MKGIILEIKGNNAVVLCKEGDFKVIKLKNGCIYNVGDEVEVENIGVSRFLKNYALSAAVFLAICLIAVSLYYTVMIPAFYISIDINPSLEFGVNRLGRVVDVKFYNDDSARLVEDKNIFKNKPLEDAVRIFINRAKMEKYLDGENPAVMFTISRRYTGKNTEKIKEALKNAVIEAANKDIRASEGSVKMMVQSSPLTMARDTSKETKDVDIIIEEVSIKKHNDARKMGISPGKLFIYEKIKEKNPGITLEEVKNKPIKNLLKEIKNENKEFLGGEESQKKVEEKDIEKGKNGKVDEKDNTGEKSNGGTKKVLEIIKENKKNVEKNKTSGQEKEIPLDKKDNIKEKIDLKGRFNNIFEKNLIEENNRKGFLKNIFDNKIKGGRL
ncbi:anti-sigma factor domain-containing protein [Thermovenabulum gondwanense]|uniref:RsgI N-terminal anti-sigma domain-containing protein n=1 Tax=Thermovenabulum gondwanense TaxID=520767 RepID=A0A161PTV3_9FIRM|nr:anti-sigma factor domain-containing protein [Thermovenabulum gondwanense]KYO65397.1 hypothetical protein ATZ99_16310 [Thermovenabulum gondwanense]